MEPLAADVARVLQAGSIARCQNPAMDQETARPNDGPFLVLSDSTLQHLLFTYGKGKSYGVESVMGGYAIISPGATLIAPYKSAPPQPSGSGNSGVALHSSTGGIE